MVFMKICRDLQISATFSCKTYSRATLKSMGPFIMLQRLTILQIASAMIKTLYFAT